MRIYFLLSNGALNILLPPDPGIISDHVITFSLARLRITERRGVWLRLIRSKGSLTVEHKYYAFD